jgi:cytochrome c oxidase assembly protein subunit 19
VTTWRASKQRAGWFEEGRGEGLEKRLKATLFCAALSNNKMACFATLAHADYARAVAWRSLVVVEEGPGDAKMGGPMSGSKPPLAPEKGVFPLDHFGECKEVMRTYLACLSKHGDDAGRCRDVSKRYLECRMERELMAKQDLTELGFGTTDTKEAARDTRKQKTAQTQRADAKASGFVGGVKSAKAFTASRTTEP